MLFIFFYTITILFLKNSRKNFLLNIKKDFSEKLQDNEEIIYITDYHFGILESGALMLSLSLFCFFIFFKINYFLSFYCFVLFAISVFYIKDAPKYNIFIITNQNIYPFFYNKQLYDRMKKNYEIMRHGFCEPISFNEIESVKAGILNINAFGIQLKLKNNKKNINGFLTNKNQEISNYINSRLNNRKE